MVGRKRQARWNRPNKAGSWELGKCVPGCTWPYYNVCEGTSVARLCASWESPLGGTLENHPHHFFLSDFDRALFSSLCSGLASLFLLFHPSFLSRVLVVPVSVTATLPLLHLRLRPAPNWPHRDLMLPQRFAIC
jgi:hypothetical protein